MEGSRGEWSQAWVATRSDDLQHFLNFMKIVTKSKMTRMGTKMSMMIGDRDRHGMPDQADEQTLADPIAANRSTNSSLTSDE